MPKLATNQNEIRIIIVLDILDIVRLDIVTSSFMVRKFLIIFFAHEAHQGFGVNMEHIRELAVNQIN